MGTWNGGYICFWGSRVVERIVDKNGSVLRDSVISESEDTVYGGILWYAVDNTLMVPWIKQHICRLQKRSVRWGDVCSGEM